MKRAVHLEVGGKVYVLEGENTDFDQGEAKLKKLKSKDDAVKGPGSQTADEEGTFELCWRLA